MRADLSCSHDTVSHRTGQDSSPVEIKLHHDQLDEKDSRVLWIAVIENAIRDSMLTKRTVRQSAREWLLADQEDLGVRTGGAG